jgi:fructoselysine-6-P-deglycase FrlB-like protein
MEREIRAQADILPACVEPLAEAVRAAPVPAGRILAGGCGDSAFAPAALSGFFRSLALDIRAATALEIAGYIPLLATDTVVLTSISGGTKRTVEAAQTARAAGARVVALTCREDSELARTADHVLLLPFTPISRKTPHTLDYTVTLQALAMLALSWSGGEPRNLARSLDQFPAWIAGAEGAGGHLISLATAGRRIFMLGGGPDLATASYGAAKLHESGGLPAVAAETENFLHGMNFSAEPDDLLIAVGTSGISRRRARAVCATYAALGVHTWLIEGLPHEPTGPLEEFSTLLSATLKLQFFCWGLANCLGLEVEQPRAGRPFGEEHLRLQAALLAE